MSRSVAVTKADEYSRSMRPKACIAVRAAEKTFGVGWLQNWSDSFTRITWGWLATHSRPRL